MKTTILTCSLAALMGVVTALAATPQGPFVAANRTNQSTSGSGNRFQTVRLVSSGGPLNVAANLVAVGDFNGDGTFQSASQVFCGVNALSIATTDFNGDNKLDLVLADLGNDDACVLMGKGDGPFQTAAIYGVDTAPSGIAVADFNGDGKIDWVAASEDDPLLSLAFGNGNGTFQASPQYTIGSFAAALGDFNKNRKMDMAVASPSGLFTFLGNGNGTFQVSTQLNVIGEAAVVVGDFNKDGNLDVVAPHGFYQDQGLVFLGNGNGTFQPQVSF